MGDELKRLGVVWLREVKGCAAFGACEMLANGVTFHAPAQWQSDVCWTVFVEHWEPLPASRDCSVRAVKLHGRERAAKMGAVHLYATIALMHGPNENPCADWVPIELIGGPLDGRQLRIPVHLPPFVVYDMLNRDGPSWSDDLESLPPGFARAFTVAWRRSARMLFDGAAVLERYEYCGLIRCVNTHDRVC
jgi:hypothetical protein